MTDSDRQSRRWTVAEDQILREHVELQRAEGGGGNWCRVALALPGRTNKDCRKRWHNSVAEGLKKGQWSKSEDQLLTSGVRRYGPQWTKVATCVSSRSADQCAKRWQQSLDPRLDRSEWRENEDSALLTAVNHLGRHWKDIQHQYLPHRSKNCVKNRYSVLARRTASQLAPYEETLESSSSDPGTPVQVHAEMPPELVSSPLTHYDRQMPYMVSDTGSDETSWTCSGLDSPNVLMTSAHGESLHMHAWPAQHDIVHPLSYAGGHSGWYNVQTTLAPQYMAQYSSVPHLSNHGCPGAYHWQSDVLRTHSCTPSMTQQIVPNTPSRRSGASSANSPGSGFQYCDSAPFGYHS